MPRLAGGEGSAFRMHAPGLGAERRLGTDPTGTETWAFTEAAVVLDTGVDGAIIGGTMLSL